MDIQDFFKLKLQIGDRISLMNDKGEKFLGIYAGDLDESKRTFSFRIEATEELQTAEINSLHILDVNHRVSS
jgi:hypothetical protein